MIEHMTAKQAFHQFVESLSEAEAEEILAAILWELEPEEVLTEEEEASLREAKAEVERGEVVEAEEVFRRYGL